MRRSSKSRTLLEFHFRIPTSIECNFATFVRQNFMMNILSYFENPWRCVSTVVRKDYFLEIGERNSVYHGAIVRIFMRKMME